MAHVFDLADNWPADHVVMIMQGWYGIPTDDGGEDLTYGVWNPNNPVAWNANNPTAYPANPYLIQDASVCNGGQRFIGSFIRPLTGIYSDSGRTASSLAVIDRNVGMIRRAGDPRARVTVLAPTVGHLAFTSAYDVAEDDPTFTPTLDVRYRHLRATLARATAAGLTNCVAANYEAYYLWSFYSAQYPTTAAKLFALGGDIAFLVNLLKEDPAAFKVDGRLVLYFYEGALTENIPETGPNSWNSVMETVRAATGHDFYMIAQSYNAQQLSWADGAFTWARLAEYVAAAGDTLREKASNWMQGTYNTYLVPALNGASYPGRVGIVSLMPGYATYVKGWGSGNDIALPRSTELVKGQIDGMLVLDDDGNRPDGVMCITWNDYPEATCWEPTVGDGTEFLELLTTELGRYFDESVDADETAALAAIWTDATPTITCPAPYRQSGRQALVPPGRSTAGGSA